MPSGSGLGCFVEMALYGLVGWLVLSVRVWQ